MRVVTEAIVLVFRRMGGQGHLHALTGQLAQRQAAHAEQHLAQAVFHTVGRQVGAIVVLARLPFSHHGFQITDQQIGDHGQVVAATVVVAPGGIVAGGKVRGRAFAGTGIGAIQILAPEQKFDGVIAGGHIHLGAAQLVQAGQQIGIQLTQIQLLFANLQRLAGNDIGAGARVTHHRLIIVGHVINQAFIQRPGIHLAFPFIHHGIAEPEDFRLHVGHPGIAPGLTSRRQGLLIGLRQQGVNLPTQLASLAQGIAVGSQRQIGIVVDHQPGTGLVVGRSRGGSGFITAGREQQRGQQQAPGRDAGQHGIPRISCNGK